MFNILPINSIVMHIFVSFSLNTLNYYVQMEMIIDKQNIWIVI